MQNSIPKLLLLTGPSGAGKSTIISHLLENPLFRLSVSYTTRQKRPTEQDGRDYHFVTTSFFERKVKEGFFIEFTEFNGNYYGTHVSSIESEEAITILDIELDGLRFFQRAFPQSFFCLVTISNREVIQKRLYERILNECGGSKPVPEIENGGELRGRMESFDAFENAKNEFKFNKVIDNSYSLEETLAQAEELTESVIEYVNLR